MNPTEARNLLDDLNEIDLSSLLILGEAGNQPILGQIAVLHVALNRVKAGGWYGHGLTGAQGTILKPFQFSCFNENDPNLMRLMKILKEPTRQFYESRGIAKVILSGATLDPTKGATHYHTIARPKSATRWPPSWAGKMQETARIEAHVFYRERISLD